MKTQATVYVIYYSTFGHVEKLARKIVTGLEKSGVNAKLFQVAETLPQDVLDKMHAPPKAEDVPFITSEQLREADGFVFGMPTRFGSMPSQMKTFFDSCGKLWMEGALYGKYAGVFFSTGSQSSGQETTALSCLPFFAHNGIRYVPLGYKCPRLTEIDQIHGGSPWGAGTVSGADGSRMPSELEFEVAEFQGFEFGSMMKNVVH